MQHKVIKINDKNAEFRKEYKALDDANLNPNQFMTLTYVYNLMKLSFGRKDFYDKKFNSYYVAVSRKTLSNQLNICEDTAGKTLSELCNMGYIIKKKTWNSGLKIFTPHFLCANSVNGNFPVSKAENIVPNKSYSRNNDITSDTKHTSSSSLNADDKIKEIVYDAIKQLKGNNEFKDVQENKKFSDYKDDEHLNNAVDGTKSLPKKASKSINIIANSLHPNNTKKRYNFIYNVNGMIFKFKSSIFKKHNLYKQSRWENNNELTNSFNTSIYEMLYNSFSGQREVDNGYAYFGGALRKFFTKIVNKILGKDTQSTQGIFKPKEQSVKGNGNHHIKEHVPEFIKHPERHTGNKLDPKKKAEIQARLKHLDAKLD